MSISKKFKIIAYSDEFEDEWDYFVTNESINGTFIQTRKFLNYHPKDKFNDVSLIIFKGSKIVCLIPGCEIIEDSSKIFFSHKGTTFGGLILSRNFFKIEYIEVFINLFENYIKENTYHSSYLKQTPSIFSEKIVDSVDYMLTNRGYKNFDELSIVIDLKSDENLFNSFARSTKKNIKRANENLSFRSLKEDKDIEVFYNLLSNNLKKHDAIPVHKYSELLDIRFRFPKNVKFFGCFNNRNKMVGGNMSFLFNSKIFHTQYTSIDYSYHNLRPADFINFNLINLAKENNFEYYSFGTCTSNNGKELNKGLAKFKEEYNGIGSINKIFSKIY